MPTQKILKYFNSYEEFHTVPGNKLCHYIGIPSIMLSLLGLLARISIVDEVGGLSWARVDGGVILLIVALAWYFWMDWKLTLPWVFVSFAMYTIGAALPNAVNWALFIGGWIFQGVGHYVYEKKSPAFFRNFEHLLVGPLWIFARVIGYHRS
jgi:uncharacterized membrane protein YGL010W